MTSRAPRTFGTIVRVRCARGFGFHDFRRRAFTLVEALVVLGILILIGGLALPGMTRWSSKYSDSAFEGQIQNAVDAARAIAITNAVAVKIQLIRSGHDRMKLSATWHSTLDREDPSTDRVKTLLEIDSGFSLSINEVESSKASPESGSTLWTVLPDGSVSASAGVSARRNDGATATVTVGTWNGSVKLGSFTSNEQSWFENQKGSGQDESEVSPVDSPKSEGEESKP